jgi:biotin carboxylase
MSAAEDPRPLLVLIGTGGQVSQVYREYLLASVSSRYRIHLFCGADPSWERPYLVGWTILNMAETVSADEMIEATRAVAGSDDLHGVLGWDEARVLQVAKVTKELGLPGGDPDAAMRCRDKLLTRQALGEAGVAQPQWALAADLTEALAAAERIGYPVVLKPRALAASLGVVRVDNPEELSDQYAFAHDTTIPGAWQYDELLVEECLTGPEISLDSAVYQGQVMPLFVARKEIGYPPYFEEVGHMVDASDPLLADPEMVKLVQDTHTALSLSDGFTHTEVKLTPTGPKIVEVNARLGGDLIPYLGLRASGMDPGLAAADVACGVRPQLVPDRKLVGGVRFFYVEQPNTTIGRIGFDESALPGAVDRHVVLAHPGEVVSPPPTGTLFGRIAFATAVAETVRECQAALDAAQAALQVEPAQAEPAQAEPAPVEPAPAEEQTTAGGAV